MVPERLFLLNGAYSEPVKGVRDLVVEAAMIELDRPYSVLNVLVRIVNS